MKKQNGYSCEDFAVRYESEIIDGERLDTKVLLDDGDTWIRLCYISGTELEQFDNELKQLIEKYRI